MMMLFILLEVLILRPKVKLSQSMVKLDEVDNKIEKLNSKVNELLTNIENIDKMLKNRFVINYMYILDRVYYILFVG